MSARLAIRPVLRSSLAVASRSSMTPATLLVPMIASRSASFQSMTPAEAQEMLIKQRSNRPTSPHLTIYKPQITMVLSGLHRITGVALSAGLYALGLSYALGPLVGLSVSSTAIAAAFGGLPFIVKFGSKLVAAAPFTFHSFNGIRHLVWDTASQLTNQAVVRTGLTVVGLSAVTTVGLLLL
ncbi:uncharacterized protein V2V93DRAFT_367946 [Kockiozyma suomiensis]|uniref:uncharacterized protein n=1 Tax=Kockiozyma suomiensis TaxID=1337062 RepID=UPI003343CAE1